MMMRVPFNDLSRQIAVEGDALRSAITRVVDSGWFVLGPEVTAFEDEFAEACAASGCVGVGSGTDALELALRAAGCRPGAEVVMAANAGGYGALACLAAGGRPVFVDVDPDLLLVTPDAVAAALTERTVAVIVTHLYGSPADVAGTVAVVPAGVTVIEDGSQAHGAAFDGRPVGGIGHLAAFSFYPTKNLGALGDGGAVTGTDDELLDRVRHLRQYGWTDRYNATVPGGRNSRLDEMQAAVLRIRLGGLDAANAARRRISARYRDAAPSLRFAGGGTSLARSAVDHLCVIMDPDRARLEKHLAAAEIGTAVHFPIPDHRQPAIADRASVPLPLPVTDAAAASVLSVPCFPELTDAEVDHVASTLASYAP